MIIKGRVIKIGDNVDTDVIIPGRYLDIHNMEELKKHVFEDLDPKLKEKIRPGTILLAGENMGCGSSREHAPRVLKEAGVSAIVAKSFARIFLRNCINIGLPVFISPECYEETEEGEILEIDTKKGEIRKGKRTYKVKPYPEFLEKIISCRGLLNYIKEELRRPRPLPHPFSQDLLNGSPYLLFLQTP